MRLGIRTGLQVEGITAVAHQKLAALPGRMIGVGVAPGQAGDGRVVGVLVHREGRVLSNDVGREPIQHALVWVVLFLGAQDVLVLSHDHVGLFEEGIGRLAPAC